MRLNRKILWVFFFLMPLLVVNVFGYETDDYEPDVTARVSRISYLTGDVKIRRADSDDWERAVQNLPVVEGDEIATASNALVEIQFDRDNYVRLAQNSYLKILNLRDEGAALSISQGSLILRVLRFDKDRKYFEIDAPGTTVSVQREGMYRVDAGDMDSREVRVSVTEDGQARVYSTNSGFTLKDGRSARIFLEGDLAGEWEMADATRYFDEFDEWAVKRDAVIAKRLKDAYYDKYYDRDIYGAEDLNDYGEWIYTRDYGYVWRPHRSSIRQYDNWSPYRYGHWRWVPPYGWTWINDEPWGWATYHYGRWVYVNGYWVWTPYGYYRPRRSWWHPAIVVVTYYENNICWYPLPYRSRYYNYNNREKTRRNIQPVAANPTPTPANIRTPIRGRDILSQLPTEQIPATAVVTVPVSAFGRNTKGFRTASPETAKIILSKEPNLEDSPPLLPTYRQLNGQVSREIRAEKPPVIQVQPNTKIGAATRSSDIPLDRQLQLKQIFGNRQPVEIQTDTQVKSGTEQPEKRRTGAVSRPPASQKNDDTDEPPIRPEPQAVPERRSSERKSSRKDESQPPVYNPSPRQEKPTRREEPRQPKREEPQYEPPKQETPKQRVEPRYDPPKREEPKSEPPPKRDAPPPSKSEPKDVSKPSVPSERKPGRNN